MHVSKNTNKKNRRNVLPYIWLNSLPLQRANKRAIQLCTTDGKTYQLPFVVHNALPYRMYTKFTHNLLHTVYISTTNNAWVGASLSLPLRIFCIPKWKKTFVSPFSSRSIQKKDLLCCRLRAQQVNKI